MKHKRKRRQSFLHYEQEIWDQGYRLIAGVDEVGRGPLAGPVVAAAVILPPDFCYRGIDDSKKLTEEQRESGFKRLLEDEGVSYGVGIVNHLRVDEINIHQASFEAMWLALAHLKVKPEYVLVDGFAIPQVLIPQRRLIKGDSLSASIAAASVVAKVIRDRIMSRYHEMYPQYGFDSNKGYSTRLHKEMLRLHGPCPIHRRSFTPCKEEEEELDLWS